MSDDRLFLLIVAAMFFSALVLAAFSFAIVWLVTR